MAYRGRYFLGQYVPLTLLCRDATFTPTVPDDVPWVSVFSSAGTEIYSGPMPVEDRYNQTGLFLYPLRLSSSYSAGRYQVEYRYALSGGAFAETDSFEIVAGGDGAGPVLSMCYYERPQAKFLVQQLGDGTYALRRNPSF